jgi:hypothetical protein
VSSTIIARSISSAIKQRERQVVKSAMRAARRRMCVCAMRRAAAAAGRRAPAAAARAAAGGRRAGRPYAARVDRRGCAQPLQREQQAAQRGPLAPAPEAASCHWH